MAGIATAIPTKILVWPSQTNIYILKYKTVGKQVTCMFALSLVLGPCPQTVDCSETFVASQLVFDVDVTGN